MTDRETETTLAGPGPAPQDGKLDLKRRYRPLYTAKARATLVEVPPLSYLMIDGHGDPNLVPEYAEAVQALFAVAYAAKFAVRRGGGQDFTVMPLQGLWWVPDMADFDVEDKSAWDWTLLVLQPETVTAEVLDRARETASAKAAAAAVRRIRLDSLHEGPAAQVLHTGPYAAEGPTIRGLHEFIAGQGQRPTGKHHEIYLGDPRRTAPQKLRTIIRQPVTP